MPSYFPVAITGTPNGELSGQLAGATLGPFVYGSDLYICIEDLDSTESSVWKSTDLGNTWSEMDGANNIPSANTTPFFDGDHTITVAWRVAGAGLQDIRLRDFDLSTGLWGSDYGTSGSPQTTVLCTVYKRPDDSIVALYSDGGPAALLTASVYSGGAWGAPIDICTNIEGLPGWDGSGGVVMNPFQSRSVMEPDTGRIHLFITDFSFITSPVIWPNRVFYQAIEADNTLGSFYDFPGQSTISGGHQDLEVFSGPPFGQPAILDGNLLLPVSLYNRNLGHQPPNYPALYIGTGLSSPSWAIDTSLSIDPDVFSDDSIYWMEAAALWTDGTTIAAVGPAQTGDPNFTAYGRLRLTQTTNVGSPDEDWAGATIWNVDDDPDFGNRMSLATVRITAGQIQVSTDFVTLSFDEARYWMGNWNPNPVLLRNRFQKRK